MSEIDKENKNMEAAHNEGVDLQRWVIKPCPFCKERVMGDRYPCWKYRIIHEKDCLISMLYGKHTYLPTDELRKAWNKRAL